MVTNQQTKMADIIQLDQERLKRLSRSSISDISETVSDPGPQLLKRIIKNNNHVAIELLREGQVSLTFTNGNTYEGTILNGILEGHGKFVWSDNTVYEGDIKNGCISGKGEYKWSDGGRYVGEVTDGYRHGNGKFYHADGHYVYDGQWNRGIKEGKGKMIFRGIETSYYEGEWSNNQQNGYGVRHYESGDFYEGEWKNSRRHGNGTMHWVTRQERYCGEWREGVQNGEGEHIWYIEQMDNSQYPLCNRYHGNWVDGLRQGHGTFHYASGAQFEGSWYQNKKHGDGRYTIPNGQTIQGIFKDDKLVNPQHSEMGRVSDDDSPSTGRPNTPLGSMIGDVDGGSTGTTQQFNMGVVSLIPPTANTINELQKVHCVILRYLTQLKRAYHFYSSLLKSELSTTSGYNNMLKRLQLWQIFADCNLYVYNLTMTEVGSLMQKAIGSSSDDVNNLSTPFLMREYLQCIVFVAHAAVNNNGLNNISLDKCLDEFIQTAFLPNVCQLKGLLFKYLSQTTPHLKQIINLYEKFSHGQTPTLRDYIIFLKDNRVIGGDEYHITVQDIVTILTRLHPLAINEGHYNLNNPMSFLEFFNSMIACSLKRYYKVTTSTPESPEDKESAIGDDINRKDEELNTEAVVESVERTESQDHDKKASHVHVMFEDQLKHQEGDIESEETTESHPIEELFGSIIVHEDDVAQGLEQFLAMFKTV